jgi:membrane-bound metal-dependent hydrolase YbcI (DUF457 family)
MFVGHYSASFLGKALAPRVPLWVFLLAAQLVDVAWVVFILLGIERFHLDPTLPSNPLVLDYMPYTHSLLGTVAWAGAAAAIVATRPRFGAARAAVAVALVVCSHWVLDVLAHRPDMTLVGGEPHLGLALWNRPLLAYTIEITLLAGAAAFSVAYRRVGTAERQAVMRGVAVLVLLQTFLVLGPVPSSPTALVLSGLAAFLLVTWAAARIERRLSTNGAAAPARA